jgi:hypothetical protein
MALVFATALAAFPGAPQVGAAQACRGNLQGDELHTMIEFDDGSRLIGPWQVMHTEGAPAAHRVAAVLDRVIEVDREGARRTTAFPHRIAVLFEGRTESDLVDNAAQVWCQTVLKAKAGSRRSTDFTPPGTRITLAVPLALRIG